MPQDNRIDKKFNIRFYSGIYPIPFEDFRSFRASPIKMIIKSLQRKNQGRFFSFAFSQQFQLEIASYESNYTIASLFTLQRCLFAIFECEKALKSNQRGCE